MRGINRLKLALAVCSATVGFGLGGAGCEQTQFGQIVRSTQGDSAYQRPPDVGQSGIVQAGYQPSVDTTYPPLGNNNRSNSNLGQLPPTTTPTMNGAGQPVVVVEEPKPPAPLPREQLLTFQPSYIIEPPDTLIIDALRLIPRPPYRIEPLDVLVIQVAETLPNQPIGGVYSVLPDGTINLGYSYGTVRVAGLTLEQAIAVIKDKNHLGARFREPQVAMALASMRAIQQIRGEHLVGQDGTVTLGSYGCVNVTGLTVWQAKLVIERFLSKAFLNPDISLTVNGYNSKVYYVIFDGGGYGQQIVLQPITGKDTVLDAIAKVGGLPPVASRRKIWVARPSPKCCYQMLPVNWEAITKGGDPATNWQLFPGDRIFIEADPLISLDNMLAKVFAPIERVLGLTLLGSSTFQSFRSNNNGTAIGGL